MKAQEVLNLIKGKNFRGVLLPHHSDVEVKLLQNKLVFKDLNTGIKNYVDYDKDLNPTLWMLDGKEYRKNLKTDSILRGQFLNRDPRFCLKNAMNFLKTGQNSYSMIIFKDKVFLFGKTRIEVEIEIINENEFTMTSKKFIKGNKELKNQRSITNFLSF